MYWHVVAPVKINCMGRLIYKLADLGAKPFVMSIWLTQLLTTICQLASVFQVKLNCPEPIFQGAWQISSGNKTAVYSVEVSKPLGRVQKIWTARDIKPLMWGISLCYYNWYSRHVNMFLQWNMYYDLLINRHCWRWICMMLIKGIQSKHCQFSPRWFRKLSSAISFFDEMDDWW